MASLRRSPAAILFILSCWGTCFTPLFSQMPATRRLSLRRPSLFKRSWCCCQWSEYISLLETLLRAGPRRATAQPGSLPCRRPQEAPPLPPPRPWQAPPHRAPLPVRPAAVTAPPTFLSSASKCRAAQVSRPLPLQRLWCSLFSCLGLTYQVMIASDVSWWPGLVWPQGNARGNLGE